MRVKSQWSFKGLSLIPFKSYLSFLRDVCTTNPFGTELTWEKGGLPFPARLHIDNFIM